MSNISNIFGALHDDVGEVWNWLTGSPTVQKIEVEVGTAAHAALTAAENFFGTLIGSVNWGLVKQKVADVVQSGVSTAEAHNNLVDLAASFVGGNATLATMVASGAVSVVGGLISALPSATATTTTNSTASS